MGRAKTMNGLSDVSSNDSGAEFAGWGRSLRTLARSLTGRLAAMAGLSDSIPAGRVEPLEDRRLMFALTVTADDVDPVTGIGTVQALFGYVIPLFRTQAEIGEAEDTFVQENFNDQGPGGPVGNGTYLNESGIQIRHNLSPANAIQIFPVGADNVTDRDLRVDFNAANQFFSFTFFEGDDAPVNRLLVTQANFEVEAGQQGDPRGIVTDNTVVELRLADQVIASFTGAALRALITNGNAGLGVGTFTFGVSPNEPGFDEIRVRSINGSNPIFLVDDINYTIPANNSAAAVLPRIFGARATISGPVGASAVFTDLYGRDMRNTLALDPLPGSQFPLVGGGRTGVPLYNDGIGSIRLSGTDSRTSFTLVGGDIQVFDDPPEDLSREEFLELEFFLGGVFQFTDTDSLTGIYDEFEEAGFGYAFSNDPQNPSVVGLPPGPGSVIVGAPTQLVRPLNNYQPFFLPPAFTDLTIAPIVTEGFDDPTQGIFIDGDENMGRVYIHGVLHGSSRFSGFLDQLVVGYMLGSASVEGDLGAAIFGTDAGQWVPDPDFAVNDFTIEPLFKTDSQLVVGRTLGEVAIAGRSLMDITVVGDLSDPIGRPARDSYVYYEKEWIGGFDPDRDEIEMARDLSRQADFSNRQATQLFRAFDQTLVFGLGTFRNDSLLASEFLGSVSSGVRVKGELSGRDTLNGEDSADVFAIPVIAGQEIVVQATGGFGEFSAPYVRILDERGQTLAAPQGLNRDARFQNIDVRWTPDRTGVFFVALSDHFNLNDGDFFNTQYTFTVTGMAAVTLGQVRTGGASGITDFESGLGNAVTVLSGDVGSIRIGSGFLGGDGADADVRDTFNTDDTQDNAMDLQGGTYSFPGNVYNISTGSDIGNRESQGVYVNFNIGGDLAQFFTGLSPAVAQSPEEGDANFINLNVGGRIGDIQISGGIGNDHDLNDDGFTFDPYNLITLDSFNLRSGVRGGNGDIGRIRTGFHIVGGTFNLRTSPGSTVGQLLVSQDVYFTDRPADGRFGIYRDFGETVSGIDFQTGFGSDVRFVDTPRIDLQVARDIFFPITVAEELTFTDDGGAQVTISITGVVAAPGTEIGRVRIVPIDGSQGVAIAVIEADLGNGDGALGGTLNITSTSSNPNSVVSIGRIIITDANLTSNITLTGNGEIDVFRIDQRGGAGLGTLSNTTPNGDFVAADLTTLNTLEVRGDLGRTQMPAFGPQLIGPFLGVVIGAGEAAQGGPLSLPGGIFLDGNSNGNVLRPIRDDNFQVGQAYLDDIGGPFDGYLNGFVIRTGSVQQVSIDGRAGDFILQARDAGGVLNALRVNDDGVTGPSGFDGIVGTIFAKDIGSIDIGDGLSRSVGPLATTGIFAIDDIGTITSRRLTGLVVESAIIAGNLTPLAIEIATPQDPLFIAQVLGEGVNAITFTGALVRDAFIGASTLDAFWIGFSYLEDYLGLGDIGAINLNQSTFFRSVADAINLNTFTITGGFFDASSILVRSDIGTIRAPGFRNSTLEGEENERLTSRIFAGGNVQTITADNDISDLVLDIIGNLRGSLTADNIIRSTVDVDNRLFGLNVPGDIRASRFTLGEVRTLAVGSDIQSSEFLISGEVTSFTAGDRIVNTEIQITGPDAALGTVAAPNLISGSISVAGPITSITVSNGDLVADIRTTTVRGTITTLSASRDLAIQADVSGTITNLVAGRNIGSITGRGVIATRGDIASVSIPNGQLYADLRTGGAFTGTVTIGGAVNKPGDVQVGLGSLIAFGRIGTVTVTGDFGGDITSYSGGITAINITNGSFLPGRSINSYEGSIAAINIVNGNLYGNVHADFDITALRVTAGADGIFGDVGVNETLSQGTPFDARRNHLPTGVFATSAIQGPRITAGRNITNFTVSGGSVFESFIYAERSIVVLAITGDVLKDGATLGDATFIGAGDSIDLLTVSGSLRNAVVFAGVTNLGSDNRPGGANLRADTVKSGEIRVVTIGGEAANTTFIAGIATGLDGVYVTADDRQVLGLSSVNTVSVAGAVTNSRVSADAIGAVDGRLSRGGTDLASVNPDLASNSGTPGAAFSGTGTFTVGADTITITVAGPGSAFFDAALNKLTVRDGTAATAVTVGTSGPSLNNFDLVTNDNGSLGVVTFNADLTGDSDIAIDGTATTLAFRRVTSTGTLAIGGAVTSVTSTGFAGGFFSARSVTTFTITGDFGAASPTVTNEASITLLTGGAITITGVARGLVSVERDLTNLTATAGSSRANYRVGGSLSAFVSGPMTSSVLSVGDALGTVVVNGDLVDSAIVAGPDLGSDGAFGGVLSAADDNGTGTIASVNITGSFRESDISAGVLRGGDGYFGTADDSVAGGRSSIGVVTIGGTATGSNRASENYRIVSTGTLAEVRVGGNAFTANGNLRIQRPEAQPISIDILAINVDAVGRQFIATIVFNQPIDPATIAPALSISEVRGTGDVLIRLINGIDYTFTYESAVNSVVVTFSRTITSRNLPVLPGVPGPGIYRFELQQGILNGQLDGALIDGNGDGFTPTNDDYSQDVIIGDAGDKFAPDRVAAGTGQIAINVDFYPPTNLDIVLDNNVTPDGLPDTNRTFTITGTIGDHPDNDTNFFRFVSDVDLYSITLTAGQIVRFGAMQGSAQRAVQALISPTGEVVNRFNVLPAAIPLPAPLGDLLDITRAVEYLITQTGTFFISISNYGVAAPGTLPFADPIPGGVGDYNFTFQVFDDGDSGFTSDTDSGDGQTVVDPPPASQFAGNDGIFGTADDFASIPIGQFTFTLQRGPDGQPNTADDVISGTNGTNISVVRAADGSITRTISSSIGPAGASGVPGDFTSDVDVFHLNNRREIAAGTRMKITVKLADTGSDLGSASPVTLTDERGSVQFGLFDTTDSINVDDGLLVFSPSDFRPTAGTPNSVIAANGETRYGFDANGDFFIEFIVPARIQGTGNGTFAVYLQGVYNTDYSLEVVTTSGTGTITKATQYVLIETAGGTVDWLQAGGFTTTLPAFTSRVLGINGSAVNGQSVDDFIIDQLVSSLNSLYAQAGIDVVFSINPGDFEFQEFSTVFLSSAVDPLIPLLEAFDAFNFFEFGDDFNPTNPFGFSEHSDPFNTDKGDEAVVYMPSFALLGLSPSPADVDLFIQSLTGAVSRRVGELVGLRITADNPDGAIADPNAADSVLGQPGPGAGYQLPNIARDLSDPYDSIARTNFFLGRQNAVNLLDRYFN